MAATKAENKAGSTRVSKNKKAPRLAIAFKDIEAAAETIAGHIEDTPCRRSRTLSDILGIDIWLKFENRQFTAAFKERGALNRLLHLDAKQKKAGVVAMSAGNHAQGVAYHARRLGIPATIVMPRNTPLVKVEGTKSHGARVELVGDTLEKAAAHAHKLEKQQRLTFVHPYDDPLVMAGQGTIAIEMLASAPDLDCLVIPVGGGGLISGMAVAARKLKPEIKIIGVQCNQYSGMASKLRGRDYDAGGETLAEGIAVKAPGRLTYPIVKAFVDDILLVSEADMEIAVAMLLNIEKTVVEGAGAAGLAAILAQPKRFKGKNTGLVLSGGNIDTRMLAQLLNREMVRSGRLARLRVDLPDKPGQLAVLAKLIGEQGANIIDIAHQRVFTRLPAKQATTMIELETRDAAHIQTIMNALRAADFAAFIFDPDEQ